MGPQDTVNRLQTGDHVKYNGESFSVAYEDGTDETETYTIKHVAIGYYTPGVHRARLEIIDVKRG